MRNINKYLAILLAVVVVSCDTVDFGDTDKNVNGAADPYPAGLLASGIMSFATTTGRYGLMVPTLYVQYQSQVTYTDEMLYADVPVEWGFWYNNTLPQLQLVINYVGDPANQTPDLLAQGSPENQVGVATIMKSIVMKRVTDTYGDVPYSEALKGADALTPKYDAQDDVYKGIISDLKAGRDMLDNGTPGPAGDIIYDGDVDKWKKLANSVIMQACLTLSKKYPGSGAYAATEFNAALNHSAGIITTVADEAWFRFEDVAGFRNPWNANRTPDYFLSQEFTDALNGNTGVGSLNPTSNTAGDSRLDVYADDSSKPGVPYGYDVESGAGKASVSNANYWNNTTPLPLMTSSYTWLNRAHAAALGWTAEDVATTLTTGITRSYETLDSHFGTSISGDAAAYAAARVADIGSFSAAQVIAEEKWVSLFGQGFDAWTEWRVTGFPVLTPATDFLNDGQIPRRYGYPLTELNLNAASYAGGVNSLSPAADKGTSKVWWDQ